MIRRVVSPRPPRPAAATSASPVLAPPPSRLGSGPWSVEQSFAYCERITRAHAENFPVASRFVPPHLRPSMWAIYAFARTADDFADEPHNEGRRAELLDEWEERLMEAFHGRADHPIFIALRETVDRRDIPIAPLRDLLTAFRMDLVTRRYPTWSALRNYTAYSAHPVGRLVLYVFDYRDADLHRFSDDFCAALQLTEFVQDVTLDLARGRVYLPQEDLAHFGVSDSDLVAGVMTPRLRDLFRYEVARSRTLFERGRPLCDRVGRDLGFELNLIWQGGMTVLDKIDAVGFDVFQRRPTLSTIDKAAMLMRSAARRWPLFSDPKRS